VSAADGTSRPVGPTDQCWSYRRILYGPTSAVATVDEPWSGTSPGTAIQVPIAAGIGVDAGPITVVTTARGLYAYREAR